MMMGGFGMMAGMGWLGILTMALFWIGVVLVLVWGISALFQNRRGSELSAVDLLQQRFARGEISREEYEHARDVLRSEEATNHA